MCIGSNAPFALGIRALLLRLGGPRAPKAMDSSTTLLRLSRNLLAAFCGSATIR